MLREFDPLVAEWFERRFEAATEPQKLGWPEIRQGRDVLISAPTGSGKTLAAFLICLDELIGAARSGSLPDQTAAVYVSPLKALSNDIRKNLEAPLAEIYELAAKQGLDLPRIRTAVRSGDTPAWERQKMVEKPPHLLVTTPESLYILLTAEKSRRMLRTVRSVIVDEIHAVADDKRGSHLALSLERLERLVGQNGDRRRLQRIGLSATVKPVEEVAEFLVGGVRGSQASTGVSTRQARELAPHQDASAGGDSKTSLPSGCAQNGEASTRVSTRQARELAPHQDASAGGDSKTSLPSGCAQNDEASTRVSTRQAGELAPHQDASAGGDSKTSLPSGCAQNDEASTRVSTRQAGELAPHQDASAGGDSKTSLPSGCAQNGEASTRVSTRQAGELAPHQDASAGGDSKTSLPSGCAQNDEASTEVSTRQAGELAPHSRGTAPRREKPSSLPAAQAPHEGQTAAASVRVIQVGHRREMELAVEIPNDELGAVASNEMWEEIYNRITELIRAHRTTLVFVNTRRLAERVTHHLEERLGEGVVLAHHGSLSRKIRLDAEQRLKSGEVKAVVATASLELGIDVGSVDLVCQIGSPRSIAVTLQRVGRSGHWVGALPKGRLFATTRDELIECTALIRAIRAGELDRLEIPAAPLDVLAQQIVAAAACEEFGEDELFELVRGAYPYRNLPRGDFDAVIEMLSEGIATRHGHSAAYLHRDQVNHRLRGRRGARLAAITSGGAIPDTAQYLVVVEPEGTTVGTLDEDFAVESLAGDVFLLGTTSWRIRRIEPGRVRVEDAHGAAPSIPFWRGEAPGRTAELSAEVSRIREEIYNRVDERAADPNARAVEFLTAECGLSRLAAEQAVDYIRAGEKALGVLPTADVIVAERFFDESGGMQLVLHAPFGARINRAWGLALRKRFCRSFNLELQAAATDNGINISLSEQHAFPLEIVFEFVKTATLKEVLTQALLAAPMFTVRWRWNLSRALAVLRFAGGRKVAPPIQRMRSEDMLGAVFPDQAACAENLTGEIRIPDHPIVRETIDNCLYEAMDLHGLRRLLEAIEINEIRTVAVETAEPSPFCHEILNANPYAFLDDAPLEERRARAVQMRRSLAPEMVEGPGALDAEAIAQVAEEAWPPVRDADELHDALLTLITVPPSPEWAEFFAELQGENRATVLQLGDASLWVAAERLSLVEKVHPGGVLAPAIQAVQSSRPLPESREACAAEILRGWLDSTGPTTAEDLAQRLALPQPLVEAALLHLESEGQILRGRFSLGLPEGVTEWCNRRLLARIHRLTLNRLRREIEPVTTADFMRFLCRRQHVASGTRLYGVDGVLQIAKQLQGYELSAAAWESQVLPRRIADYKPELLDRLCLAGEVMWGRLSPHPAFENGREEGEGRGGRKVRPTRVAPIALWLREDAEWLLTASEDRLGANNRDALSHPARAVLSALETRGASFFRDLVRASGRLASEVEDGLWELVAAGLVTADGFENLRALIDPKRRRGEGRGRRARPRHAAGRWTLLAEAARGGEEADPAEGVPRVISKGTEEGGRTRGSAPTMASEGGASQRSEPSQPGSIEAFARQLLRRWGVVFRDLLRRETLAPPWRELLVVLRRMEARSEIRGGRFVAAFVGEQFALPEAVELLRSVKRSQPDAEEIVFGAADPLNLVGSVLPGDRVSAGATGTLRLRDGVPVERGEEPSLVSLATAGNPSRPH